MYALSLVVVVMIPDQPVAVHQAGSQALASQLDLENYCAASSWPGAVV
jgi:hypothetical protein